MRILAVDPGTKRLGLALSDPTGTIAQPLKVLRHVSRDANASAIAKLATQKDVRMIVVGQALDAEGQPTLEGRRAARLAGALRAHTAIPVVLWDESHSTQAARAARQEMRGRARSRQDHLDDLAATVILQSYLDARAEGTI